MPKDIKDQFNSFFEVFIASPLKTAMAWPFVVARKKQLPYANRVKWGLISIFFVFFGGSAAFKADNPLKPFIVIGLPVLIWVSLYIVVSKAKDRAP